MIELTEPQRRAIAEQPDAPIRVVDPATRKEFVLVSADAFNMAKMKNTPNDGNNDVGHDPTLGIAPLLLESMRAFWKELPTLVQSRWKRGKWVAYWRDCRIGVAQCGRKLMKQCQRKGFDLQNVYFGHIHPQQSPPWEPDEMDGTLIEFDDESLENVSVSTGK